MYFSKAINGFIPQKWIDDGTYETLPTDAIELTAAEIAAFYKVIPPAGKDLDILNGRLAWVDLPPATSEELIADAEQKRALLRSVADAEIAWRQYAVDAGIATSDETSKLAGWKEYVVLLMRIDLYEPKWPQQP